MLSPRKAFKLIWNKFCAPVGKYYPGWLKLADLFLLTNESSQSQLSILKVRVPTLRSLDEGALLGRVRINCLIILPISYYCWKYFREIFQHLVIKKSHFNQRKHLHILDSHQQGVYVPVCRSALYCSDFHGQYPVINEVGKILVDYLFLVSCDPSWRQWAKLNCPGEKE